MNSLMMVFLGGRMMVGRIDGVMLFGPRMFSLFQEGQVSRMGMSPLPGNPDVLTLRNYDCCYVVKDEKIEALYLKVTTGLVFPGDSPLGKGSPLPLVS